MSEHLENSGSILEEKPRRGIDWWLLGLCSGRALSQVIVMTYAAAIPILQQEWGMSAMRAGTISSGFQLGYAVSLFVISILADKWGPRGLYVWSIFAGALLSAVFAGFARDYLSALILYSLVAMALGGSYTTGLMIIADRYPVQKRGKASGFLIASTSLGYVLSLALSGLTIPIGGYRLSFITAAACCFVSWFFSWLFLRRVRLPRLKKPEQQSLVTAVLSNKPVLLLIGAYILHSWELLGMWSWTPAFLAACLTFRGFDGVSAAGLGSYVMAALHVSALFASFLMGALSDRLGRGFVIMVASGVSTLCSFVFGWSMGLPFMVVFAIGLLYMFFAIGDSPVLSAALTEVTSAPFLGRAFGIRSLVGYSAGAASPVVFGALLDWTNPTGLSSMQYTTWGWAFISLGLPGIGTFLLSSRFSRVRTSDGSRRDAIDVPLAGNPDARLH